MSDTTRACPACGRRFGGETAFCPFDGRPLGGASVGSVFDDLYEIEARLGAGAMGVVYRARHSLLKDVVALKVMSGTHASPAAFRRFLVEGQAARRFRHPNAVSVFDLRVARDGTPYLVLEYVEGRTLRQELVRQGRFEPREAIEIVSAIASALDAAHAAGVVHRDLKPENVMLAAGLDGAARVKVLDLGVAKVLEDGDDAPPHATIEGGLVGTPHYMSPEQWGVPPRDGGTEVDGRADVYSLAVMTFELLVGSLPFAGRGVSELRRHHVRTLPPPVGGAVPDLPAGVEDAVARGLAKDRSDRPGSAGAFARELRREHGREPIPASPASRIDAPTVRLDGVPSNLPWPITSFVGRARELADIGDLLERARLVTLAGAGGVGKTRLALEAAAAAGAAHPDGVWYVDLAPLADSDVLAAAVAEAIGAGDERAGDALTALRARLARGRSLLVLDSCERVLDATAALAATLLGACPGLRILATSREPLGVAGETVSRVAPLAPSESVRLFLERTQLARPGVDLERDALPAVEMLCRRLDGVPLALELAAGSTRMYTVEQLLERLDQRHDLEATAKRGVPERQRSLRAAVEWGYAMLSEDERVLLRRLSVFRGGWDLDAASAVAGEVGAEGRTLSLLMRLADASFVVSAAVGGERSRLLETIRAFAEDRLRESDEAGRIEGRHRAWFLELARRAAREMDGSNEDLWLARLGVEHDNFREVLRRPDDDPAAALELAVTLERYWSVRGFWEEGRRAFARALAAAEGAHVAAALLASALNKAGSLELNVEEPERAVGFYERAVALRRSIGDRHAVANSTHNLAIAVRQAGDPERAETLYAESLALYRELGEERGEAVSLTSLGALAADRGDYVHARGLYNDCLDVFRRIGDRRMVGLLLGNLGEIAWLERSRDDAVARLGEALEIASALGFKALDAHAREVLGRIALEDGELDRARTLLTEALALQADLGGRTGIAGALEALACLAAAEGNGERAVELAASASSLRTLGGRSSAPMESERATLERYLKPVRAALDADAIQRAERRAAALGTEATIRRIVVRSP